MKTSRKIRVSFCIIAFILIFVVGCILYFNQKPNFSAYHSYSVDGIPITDEDFQRIVDVYENDKTLSYWWYDALPTGYDLRLYRTEDMSGECDYMCTGDIIDMWLVMDGKGWTYDNQNTARQVNAIIEEIIEKSEKE